MKARENYRITAVRLVEFHNLGTTTVPLPEGGHLFLLGDNGSGKTTLLDAIHLVLTAGREMEFNSAARVAGAKDSGGRTYQGVVLRYNAVTGRTARESGITYAALELKSDQGRTISLAVGLAAEGLDIAIDRWGGIASVPVAELPLTIEENGRQRAATAAEFKRGLAALTGGRAYTHINDYADAVGARLFGGADKYADVCKLLRTGKAYREIAARAANYDEFFRQLLEDPSRETFEPLLKGLRELEESKARLEQIDERERYLKELDRESRRLGELRLKTDMVAWAEAEARRKQASDEAASLADAIAAGEADSAAIKKATAEAHAETERQRERLAELRTKDATGLVNREKRAAAHLAERKRVATDAADAAMRAHERANDEKKAAEAARKTCRALAKSAGETLSRLAKSAGAQAGRVTDALFAMANGADGLDGADGADADAAFDAVRETVRKVCNERQNQVFSAEREATAAAEAVTAAEGEVAKIKSQGDALPRIEGFAEARENLRAAMLAARPVYELIEPAPGCDARHLALIERLLGEDFLATWVSDGDQADLVRREVWKSEGEMSVAVRGESDAADPTTLAPWLGNFISFEESDVEAVRLVASQLAATVGPKDADFLSLKTWSYRYRHGLFAEARGRLIGRKARAAEQARRLKAAEEKLAEAERRRREAEKERAAAEAALAAADALAKALDEARSKIWQAQSAVRGAEQKAAFAAERAKDADELAAARLAEANAAAEELEDIRLKMREAGIDGSLEKKIAAVERKVREGEAEEQKLHRERGATESRLAALRSNREARLREAEAAAARTAGLAAGLVREGETVEIKVRSLCPEALTATGTAGFAALREKFVSEASVAKTKIEQKIRDAKGEAYSFSFDAAANILTDRRGSALAEVLADESRRLEELRGVIDRKTREVFERIFMGEVMRRLSLDLMQIEGLVGRIQRKLAGRRFGSNRYQFALTPVPEYEGFVKLVRNIHLLDADEGKDDLRAYLEQHRDEIMNAEIDAIPDMFDYRKWFRFQLKVLVENDEGRVIDRKVKSIGSGGEQAVPNYLLILTVAEFLYHGGESADPPKAAPLLFDEAFYGIDAARRDQLLAFAEDLGLQLFVSSPDQDGVKREIKHSVSLIVVKDENLDVHLSPINWTGVAVQSDIFGAESAAPGMTIMEETK